MPPAVTRELSITYGTTTVGGTSAAYLLLDDPAHIIDHAYSQSTVAFAVLVLGTSEADFYTQCDALEVAFRDINQPITITLGSETWTWTHSDNTGFLSRPQIRKRQGPADSGRSRIYDISILFQRPADKSGKSGLREGRFELFTGKTGQRAYTLSGTYTALSTNAAEAQFDAAISTLQGTYETAHSVANHAWERQTTRLVKDDEDKILTFEANALEIFYNQSSGVLNNAKLKDQKFTVVRMQMAPGDISDAQRPLQLFVSYDVDVDKAQTTDLVGLWTGTIKPWIIEEVTRISEGSSPAIVRNSPRFDYPHNRISADLEVWVVTGSNILIHQTMTRDDKDEGKVVLPVWNGSKYAAEVFDGPGSWFRTVTDTRVTLGGGSTPASKQAGIGGVGGVDRGPPSIAGVPLFGGRNFSGAGSIASLNPYAGGGGGIGGRGGGGGDGKPGEAPAGDGQWILLGTTTQTSPKRVGSADGSFDIVELTEVSRYRYVEVVTGAGGGAGGGTGVGFTTSR